MAFSGMLRRVALVRMDVSEQLSASIIRVQRVGELGMLAVTSNVPSSPNLVTLMMKALSSCEKSVLTRATRRNIPEDAILNELVVYMGRISNNIYLQKILRTAEGSKQGHLKLCQA
jgi:hypothetical protein